MKNVKGVIQHNKICFLDLSSNLRVANVVLDDFQRTFANTVEQIEDLVEEELKDIERSLIVYANGKS